MVRSLSAFGLSVLLASSYAFGQYPRDGRYQGQEAMRVSVEELLRTPGMYNDRLVITQGEVRSGDSQDIAANIYELEGEGSNLRTVRVATPAFESMNDLRFLSGRKVEVTGIFFDLGSVMMPERHPVLRNYPGAVRGGSLGFDKNLFLAATHVDVLEEESARERMEAETEDIDLKDPDIAVSDSDVVDLRDLTSNPEPYVDKQIAVIGKFRGNNLYGDLSIQDKRTPRDFVIKVADAAIWVTGKLPRGKDFRLDPKRRRDTGKWLRVIGRPWKYEDKIYLRAEKVELTETPDDPDLQPVRKRSKAETEVGPPPQVDFTLPLDGEQGIALDSEFQIQFSKDMKEPSFNRNVDLLYADDDGLSNPFPDLEIAYDAPSRSLTVRPHKMLDPGRELWLILYDAIEDEEGQKLPATEGAREVDPAAAVVLVFHTAR